jgi:hypothetical protein
MPIVSIINAIFDTTKKQNIPGAYKTAPQFSYLIMGINHLQLSPELIAALYPETLVAGNDPGNIKKTGKMSVTDLPRAPAYSFLGKNLRSICFLVDCPGQDYIPEKELGFLLRILSACKCSLDDIALVNAARLPIRFNELTKQLQPRILILWGIRPVSIGLKDDLPDFSISPLEGVSVIPVLTPDLMSGESPEGLELKQRLWACLKRLFNL